MARVELPANADFVVVGAGSGGCAAAAELAKSGVATVLVLEAGPDYGPYNDGQWPEDLLEAGDLADSHAWGYDSGDWYSDRVIQFYRARVIGGCSSHNGCAAIWGHRLDYDDWVAQGNPGWSTDELLPYFQAANKRMRVAIPELPVVTPFQRLMLESAITAGVPRVADLNNLDEPVGMAPSPANIVDGVRWNCSFAYLDPIRNQSTVTICGDALVDSVVVEAGRVTGVRVIRDGRTQTVSAGTVVLTGGAYNSPQVLLRSGIGPATDLADLGIKIVVDLPGVGLNLHDHSMITYSLSGSPELEAQMADFAKDHWMPEEQTIAKIQSKYCTEGFDLHIYPEGGPYGGPNEDEWHFDAQIACMIPKSRGSLKVISTDPESAPLIDHNYIGDPEGHDLAILVDGLEKAREMFAQAVGTGLLGKELEPGPGRADEASLREWIRQTVWHYYHPVGSCKMGPESDPEAVVNARGAVRGVEGLYIADCAIMPQIPRANTNLPAIVVGTRIGDWLATS